MKNFKTLWFIASILMLLAVSCNKEDEIIDDPNNHINVPVDYRDIIVGQYICTRTFYSNQMGEVTTSSSPDTIFVTKDTSSNMIFVDSYKYYIGGNYYFSSDHGLSTQFEMYFNHGQFDTLGPITIHYVYNQHISPGGTSNITIDGYKE